MGPMSISKISLCSLLWVGGPALLSCNKTAFLDKKPNTTLVVPTSLTDFQTLLDNDIIMSVTPVLGELSADNFYLTDALWQSLDTKEYNAYIWAQDIYQGQGGVEDWNDPYQQVFYANVVLAGLPAVPVDNSNLQQWNTIMGSALFIRAYAFYNLVQLFAPMYDSSTASTDLGIPIRLSPDINVTSVRSSVQVSYDQIISDLKAASHLLPVAIPDSNLNRPSRPAAFAELARVYLGMGAYSQAGAYADSCLQLYNTLMDYSSLSSLSSPLSFSKTNVETMYQSNFLTDTKVFLGLIIPGCIVDSLLYRSYDTNDLRRVAYYTINSMTGLPNIKGSYNGSIYPFSGLATDEVYLIKAECAARAGDKNTALAYLNMLMQNRWAAGKFVPFATASAGEALDSVLVERRKELAFRGLRFTDLRRLNKEGANIGLTRFIGGQSYLLAPNSPLYVLPIPPDVIALSGIQQNTR